MILWIFLFSLIKCEGKDLPYDDTFSKNYDDSIDYDDPLTPTPAPTPTPTPEIYIPLKDILGLREVIVASIILLSLLIYIIGKNNINKTMKQVQKKFATELRKYFLIVPDTFKKVSKHEFLLYLTGRSGYMGGFVTIQLSKRLDILGFLWDKIMHNDTTITYEFLCEPINQSTGIYSARPKLLKEYSPYDLAETPLPEMKLSIFSDFGSSGDKFTEMIKQYGVNHTNQILEIDMNDMNRFETRIAGRFVARFKFNVKDIDNIVDNQTIDFMMKMADSFITLELSEEAYQHNIRVRAVNISKGTGIDPQHMADSLITNKMRFKEEKKPKNKMTK